MSVAQAHYVLLDQQELANELAEMELAEMELAEMELAARQSMHEATAEGQDRIVEMDLLTRDVVIDLDELILTHQNSLSAQDLDSIIWLARLGFLHAASLGKKKTESSQT